MRRLALSAVVLFLMNSCEYDANDRLRTEMNQLRVEVLELQGELRDVEQRVQAVEARYHTVRSELGLDPSR